MAEQKIRDVPREDADTAAVLTWGIVDVAVQDLVTRIARTGVMAGWTAVIADSDTGAGDVGKDAALHHAVLRAS